ncbi:PREDICTED: 1-aminocyclopropane-1-carboxylate synthase-like protein 1 [Nanorana parkeri]|uniref:1-aminocyclopropane-1-carboxylate synthase-like protein 1 n=1 Tax=Nanorana parkeri TaxID=125878 RepID=UPI000854794F|nr:PREDICTED: 1-aminocyclopropane-1-carboxylate synthase-like protein 1 [Nanorana parkeri]
MDFRGKKYERGSNWSDPEVVELLQLWGNESVQMELESCLRNQHVFNRIADALREKGIHRTGDQCREKIKKMKLEYRRLKDNSKTLRGGRAWKFYEVMDRVLTHRPTLSYGSIGPGGLLNQHLLQNSLSEGFHGPFSQYGHSQTHPEMMEIKSEDVQSDEQCLTPEPPMTYIQDSGGEQEEDEQSMLDRGGQDSPISRVEVTAEVSVSPSGFSEANMAGSSGHSTHPQFWRKRKPLEPLEDLIAQMLMAQRASEERFLQLEERRMVQEQEAEERRLRLEERRLQLDRQHELRMFTVFAQMLGMIRQSGGESMPMPPSNSGLTPEGDNLKRASTSKEPEVGDVYSCKQFFSPYLSSRGNILCGFRGSSEEGYRAYHEDKYDEDKNPNGIINFGTSENKLCFDLMSKRLTQSDMNVVEPPLLQYPDWKGHGFLREEVARFLTYYCKTPAPLTSENVVILNGCGSLFSALAAVLCDAGDSILIPTPFYGGITQSIFLYSGIKLAYVHLTSKVTSSGGRPFQLTVQKMESALQTAKEEGTTVKALILINPHNPLGDVYSASEMLDFLEFAKRHSLHVIVDEIYMLSVFDESSTFHSVLSFDKLPDPQRTHVMWGISKDFAVSGVRFGTLYSQNQDVCNGVASLCYFHGVCGPVQYMMAQLLRDRDWINQIYLRVNHARLRAAQAFVADELRALNVPFLNRGAGFFTWIDFRKYLRAPTFEEEVILWRDFLDNNVLLSCGKAFECCEPGWFRIIFSDKTHRLQLGMQRIRKVLEMREKELQPEQRNRAEEDGKADSTDEVIYVSSHREPSGSNLSDLIVQLQHQMRSSDWLQQNTAENFAQQNPDVFQVYSKFTGKQ